VRDIDLVPESTAIDVDDHRYRLSVATNQLIRNLGVATWDDLRFPAAGLGVSEEVPAWVQPVGAIDAYAVGELVQHDNPNDSSNIWVYESSIPANTTEPGRDGTFDRWWEPISLASAYAGSGNAPSRDPDLGTLVFENDKTQVVGGLAQMPHSWAEGTVLRPHVHWVQSGSGAALWQLEYRLMPAGGGAFPSTWTSVTSDTLAFPYTSGDWVQITPLPEIDMTGFELSAMVLFRLTRRGTEDTLASDLHLLEFDIHYQSLTYGSINEFSN